MALILIGTWRAVLAGAARVAAGLGPNNGYLQESGGDFYIKEDDGDFYLQE